MEKRAEKTILEYLADQIVIINLKKADIKLVLKDMLQNLVIGYIPVEYYGVLLTSYLSYGIAIIMKIIISIVLRYSKQINALYEGNARLLDY